MTTVHLGHQSIQCSRELIRIQTATGIVDVRRGETKSIPLGYVARTLDWYCKEGEAENLEDQPAPNDHPFNRVVITRFAGGREANVFFYFDCDSSHLVRDAAASDVTPEEHLIVGEATKEQDTSLESVQKDEEAPN